MGGQKDFPVKGTVKLGNVVKLTTDDTEMLGRRLETFPTAFSCARGKDEFLVSPETFSTGERDFSTETCMLPLDDKL
jgi:hypothetical protein